MTDPELVTIANYLFPHEARIAQAHLEAYDIPVFLENVNLITNDWLLATAIGGVPLKVPRACEDTARALLQSVDLDEDQEDEESC